MNNFEAKSGLVDCLTVVFNIKQVIFNFGIKFNYVHTIFQMSID